jgi:hypothetical protein
MRDRELSVAVQRNPATGGWTYAVMADPVEFFTSSGLVKLGQLERVRPRTFGRPVSGALAPETGRRHRDSRRAERCPR